MLSGMAGMSESEFWSSSLRYMYRRIEGMRHLNEMKIQAMYEVARYQASIMLQPYAKKNSSIKPSDLGKFIWEMSTSEMELDKAKSEERLKTEAKRIEELQQRLAEGLKAGTIDWKPVNSIE